MEWTSCIETFVWMTDEINTGLIRGGYVASIFIFLVTLLGHFLVTCVTNFEMPFGTNDDIP